MHLERLQFHITGQVQGVGFRPHVFRIAKTLGLTGWVQNNAAGVLIEIQGVLAPNFLSQLTKALPPLAKIYNIQTQPLVWIEHEMSFQIVASQGGMARTIISPDTSICSDCLSELFDLKSRYHGYPFLNCTHCGPRLTITRGLPYDRKLTSMEEFPLCVDCQKDYLDPDNRRYHAQPTACGHCGPQLSSTIEEMVKLLSEGGILALKGLGGYQLLCDAKNKNAISMLRQRKNREAKPFALMVVNTQSAECFTAIDNVERQLLMSSARPIVLLKKKDNKAFESVAPGLSHLGIMLPSTPLHYLLLHALVGYPKAPDWLDDAQSPVLVVTSANLSGSPLITDDEMARSDLLMIADKVVSYNRKILTRVDDSVVRVINQSPMFIRRARGYVPECIKLPFAIPTTLALGGHLKNTFCITRHDEAFVSQHIGGLNNGASIEFFHESLTHWMHMLDVNVERVACDLHPDFYTSRLAERYDVPIIPVQHHHAHIASVIAEHHILSPVLGLALDGYGYGHDGQACGGELFFIENKAFQQIGHFLPIPLPSGELAAREPWRMGASILHRLGMNDKIAKRFIDRPQASLLAHLLASSKDMALTTSCGRLFDAASALLGINLMSQYEGQAAGQLESLVTAPEVLPNGWSFENDQFSLLPTFDALLNLSPVRGANLFHGTLVAGLASWILSTAVRVSSRIVLLSGGCFLNKVLSEGLSRQLMQYGLEVVMSHCVPPNDGGLSLGQAWVAGTREY